MVIAVIGFMKVGSGSEVVEAMVKETWDEAQGDKMRGSMWNLG